MKTRMMFTINHIVYDPQEDDQIRFIMNKYDLKFEELEIINQELRGCMCDFPHHTIVQVDKEDEDV